MYLALTTSLLAQSELTVQQVGDALKNEEAHKTGIAAAAAVAAASTPAAAPASTSHHSNKPKRVCTFCGRNGHIAEKCYKLEEASKKAKEDAGLNFGKGKGNSAQDSNTPMESAGAASVHLSSTPSALPDSWNADTGATSHMTPRCNWFKSYGPSNVAIWVANGQVVYAAGVGTVEFLFRESMVGSTICEVHSSVCIQTSWFFIRRFRC